MQVDLSQPLVTPPAPPPVEAPFETKLLIPGALAEAAAAWIEARIPRDPHAVGPEGTYTVGSLYFDTPHLEIYRRAHAASVAKYRIRRYGAEERLFLECKEKLSGRVVKRRSPIAPSDLSALAELATHDGWPATWFAAAVRERDLRPVCRVSYVRRAWIGELDGQRVRVTLDRDLRAGPAAGLELPGMLDGGRLLFRGCVLEIKHAGGLPPSVQEWLAELGCSPQPLSKYRTAVEVCGVAAA
ncbi:MAG: polyphosphate polymerase domain-containing protein [Armatimonadota bacterium]